MAQFRRKGWDKYFGEGWSGEEMRLLLTGQIGAVIVRHSGICDHVKQMSGCVSIKGQDMFFWFFESRSQPRTDPLLLYISGGPGTSSMKALGSGVGPCYINRSLMRNPHSWSNRANMLFVEQPFGTGLSTGTPPSNSFEAADDVVLFLNSLVPKLPKFGAFAIAGAGHVIPSIALRLKGQLQSRLGSVIVGSGWIHPKIQLQAMYRRACHRFPPLANQLQCDEMRGSISIPQIDQCMENPNPHCADLWDNILSSFLLNGVDMGDTRFASVDSNEACIKEVFDLELTKEMLGIHKNSSFQVDSVQVYDTFHASGDNLFSSFTSFERLLNQGKRILLYCGHHDFMSHCSGIRRIANRFQWPGSPSFKSKKLTRFRDQYSKVLLIDHTNLTYANFLHSGHEVYRYQPKALSDLITGWLHAN